jgi:hypothetical protein
MTARWTAADFAALGALLLGLVACAVGIAIDRVGFCRAWLASFLFWLGVPLCGVTLVLVHDLTGGEWMATARPVLAAATATMPIATLAGIPAFAGLHSLYDWTHPDHGLANAFYLNDAAFILRYAIYVVLWNLLAAFALWGRRMNGAPIVPAWSWLSGVGLILLAFSVSFAAIDWILSLEPTFWSSVFPMIAGASWFNTGLALVLLVAAVAHPALERRDHLADMAAILFATTIFWAYVEFVQFLIIWEENLKSEIPWYLVRLKSAWHPALDISVAFGFVVPFFVLLWGPTKRHRGWVAASCALILASRLADKWWLVMPESHDAEPFWLAAGAVLALGGLMMLLFLAGLRYGTWAAPAGQFRKAGHG